MANFRIHFHPLAADEVRAARNWYNERNAGVSDAFFAELDAAILAIVENPQRWPQIYLKYRRYLLRNFPFSVIYLVGADFVEVLAMAHHRRRPGYWLSR